MSVNQTIIKKIENNTDADMFIGDVLLFEVQQLEQLGLDPNNCNLFRSGRMKNDMPSVCRFGVRDERMTDCIGAVKESGDGKEASAGNIIVSDHLTILGTEENAVVLAFSGGERHLIRTEISVDASGAFAGLKVFAEINRLLKPGEAMQTEKFEVIQTARVNETIQKWADKRAAGIPIRTKQCPCVYCTWYYYERTLTYDDVLVNLEKIKERNLPFDVFQIDDGWEDVTTEWEPNEKFPVSMKTVAQTIRSYGLTPGIWTSPFIAHEKSPVWQRHPDWILRQTDGEPSVFSVNGLDYFIFDISIAETWDYFEKMYHRLTFDWGFAYHKLDFSRAPVIAENVRFANPYITIAECYRKAVEAIRRGMGEDAFFLMCGGLYEPLIGVVDAQRAGSDVLSMWSSDINKNGKTIPYTVKQNLLRYYMNRWWYNDPDALMIRKNETMERGSRLTYGLLNEDEVKTCVLNQLIGGGLVCSTEPLDKIDDGRLSNFNHILPIRQVETELVNLLGEERFPSRIRLKEKGKDGVLYLVLINWDDEQAIEPIVTLSDFSSDNISCKDDELYMVCDFYGQAVWKNQRADFAVKLPEIPPHASTILKLTVGETNHFLPDYAGHYLM
ncbi:MAG TPA: hypothetical protein DDY98_06385 [Ruminococcaceae bacterium]|nr:hypothetical protein [Oscillospiraceae bacterium]